MSTKKSPKIKVDTKQNFNEQLNDMISKASCKVKTLWKVMPYINLSKKKILLNSLSNSQVSYCSLICMFSSHMNNKIYHLNEMHLHQSDVIF